MLTIAKLFGRSPFSPMQTHMEKVANCLSLLPDLLEALKKKDSKKIEELAKQISKKEHEADLTKNEIRSHLPKSLFMPIDRGTLLEILSLQDSFADKAEDIAVVLTLKDLNYDDLKNFEDFFVKNIESFFLARDVIKEFDALLETSFGGAEAQKVKKMIDNLALKEHELDILGYALAKKLYSIGDKLSYPEFHLWQTLLMEVGDISNIAEKLGNKILMILELK